MGEYEERWFWVDDPPKCVVPETASKYAICQVQRDAKRAGGVVIVKYISKPYQICK